MFLNQDNVPFQITTILSYGFDISGHKNAEKKKAGDALYIFIFNNSINEYPFSEAIRSPLLAATLAVGTAIPRALAKCVMVSLSSKAPSGR